MMDVFAGLGDNDSHFTTHSSKNEQHIPSDVSDELGLKLKELLQKPDVLKGEIDKLSKQQAEITKELETMKFFKNFPEQALELEKNGLPFSEQVSAGKNIYKLYRNYEKSIELQNRGITLKEQASEIGKNGGFIISYLLENSDAVFALDDAGLKVKETIDKIESERRGTSVNFLDFTKSQPYLIMVENYKTALNLKEEIPLQEQLKLVVGEDHYSRSRKKTWAEIFPKLVEHKEDISALIESGVSASEQLKTIKELSKDNTLDNSVEQYYNSPEIKQIIEDAKTYTNFAENLKQSREGGSGMEIGGDKISDPREKPSESWASQA